ncbi:virulence RhuM family protein [Flavobacterium sp. F52]|uniref:virulence RhuM family protein n=1 Tax=Flavobacterium sp. F52 TaxID=1202532 RepID=UPI000272F332|nr:virulence RhuM family protein [Flavobacterium sp. F52]EJG01216.1 DNA-binding protein [Flavobacterium sp. F52]
MTKSEIIIYSTADGLIKIQTRLENDTVWLTQAQMSELFGKDRSVITKHIANVFKEGELEEKSNVQILHIANSDKPVKFYNLDVIISVGYRVKSFQGTRFRQWATARLREYIVKGFTMNDEMLKQTDNESYFEELLARIRDIRSSEKVFWRKVLDIYATSVDYDPRAESSKLFFQTIQNKMHWAAHGHTAAEVIYERINAQLPNLGLTNFRGEKPTKQEIEIAKNYLNEDELNVLNRMVTAYLDLAEIQALNRKPMYMKTWIEKLDEFIKITGNEILEHNGSVSHQKALDKANDEYIKYKEQTKNDLSEAERHFIKNIEETNKNIIVKKKSQNT